MVESVRFTAEPDMLPEPFKFYQHMVARHHCDPNASKAIEIDLKVKVSTVFYFSVK